MKFSIAPIDKNAPEFGLGKWADPYAGGKPTWLVSIPDLPVGEYDVHRITQVNGDVAVLIQRVGPPGDYCK